MEKYTALLTLACTCVCNPCTAPAAADSGGEAGTVISHSVRYRYMSGMTVRGRGQAGDGTYGTYGDWMGGSPG